MFTLPQGETNLVAHMMNGMNKVLCDFIPQVTTPFLDDVPIKGCEEGEKDETMDLRGNCKFFENHILDCEKILSVMGLPSSPKPVYKCRPLLEVVRTRPLT